MIRDAFRSLIAHPSSSDAAHEDTRPFLEPTTTVAPTDQNATPPTGSTRWSQSPVPYDTTDNSSSGSSRAARPHTKKPDKDKNYTSWLMNTRESTLATEVKVTVSIPPSTSRDRIEEWLLDGKEPPKRKKRRQWKRAEGRNTCQDFDVNNKDTDDSEEDDKRDPWRARKPPSRWMKAR